MNAVKSLQFNMWREDGTPGKVFIAEDEVAERLAELHNQGWTRIQWTLDAERRREREYDQEWNIDSVHTVVAVAERIRERAPYGREPHGWARARAAEERGEVVARSDLPCSFCGKPPLKVKKMVSGPRVAICNECVQLCWDIIFEPPKDDEFEPPKDDEFEPPKDDEASS